MGKQSHGETLAKIIVAFLEKPVWKQVELERRCQVSGRTIRARILDLQQVPIPIEREEDRPHVYYSVPEGWFPRHGTGLESLDQVQVARQIGRLPKSSAKP